MSVHNHPPYRPVCNERDVDGQLRGACLNDDGTPRNRSGDEGVDPTHGGNHAPLPEGVRLDPGYCAGCDGGNLDVVAALDRALSAWEAKGSTSLTTALLVEAAYAARAALRDPS